jgi:hypothetical protein
MGPPSDADDQPSHVWNAEVEKSDAIAENLADRVLVYGRRHALIDLSGQAFVKGHLQVHPHRSVAAMTGTANRLGLLLSLQHRPMNSISLSIAMLHLAFSANMESRS